MRETEGTNGSNGSLEGTKSMHINGSATPETAPTRRESKTSVALRGAPIAVSEQQFLTVKEETLESLSLLNSSANVLLSAMNSMVPPKDSGRNLGEYTASGMRKISKSICDIIQTKCAVIRQIHSIARDE